MSERTWQRLGAATGILAGLTPVAFGIFDPGSFPDPDDRASAFVSFVSDHGSDLRATAFVLGVSGMLLLWFGGSLRASLRRAEGGDGRLSSIAFAGGVAFALLAIIGGSIQAQLAFFDDEHLSPERVKDIWLVLSTTGDAVFGATVYARAVLVGAASWCAVRFGGLPKWLGWIGLVVALASLVGSTAILDPSDESILGLFWFVSFLATFAWILIAGIVLTLRAGTVSAER